VDKYGHALGAEMAMSVPYVSKLS